MTTISPNVLSVPCQLSDQELLARVRVAAQAERRASAELIALLLEMDSRRLYLGEGFSSLFTYCTQVLHLSEHAAYNRIEAARAARRFPVVLDLIAEGAVTLTSVRLLAPHLTPENHRDVLERARHKSKRDIELLVAGLHPQPDVPAAVRKLPTPAVPTMHAAKTAELVTSAGVDATGAIRRANEQPGSRFAEVKPMAPERYKIQFTVDRATYDTLRRAQDLLRHAVPTGDPAVIFGRAVTLLVEQLERRKNAATGRPQHPRGVNGASRHIPAFVKRTVWQRDGGRCAFEGKEGVRKPAFSNITTWYHSQRAARRQRGMCNCGVEPTTGTRPSSISVGSEFHCYAKNEESTGHRGTRSGTSWTPHERSEFGVTGAGSFC